MRIDDTKNYKKDNPVSMTRRIQNTAQRLFWNLLACQFKGHGHIQLAARQKLIEELHQPCPRNTGF